MSEQATSVRWKSREEFLKSRSGPYYERMYNLGCSDRLAYHASWDEIRALREVLCERYRVLGRELRQIKTELGPQALQQPGEGLIAWLYRERSADDQARVQALLTCKQRRQDINQLLRDIDDGRVPMRGRSSSRADIGEMLPLLATIQQRYETAYRAALAARWAEIDEADWQRELEHRAKIEAGEY